MTVVYLAASLTRVLVNVDSDPTEELWVFALAELLLCFGRFVRHG